jgi:hypothetical protein
MMTVYPYDMQNFQDSHFQHPSRKPLPAAVAPLAQSYPPRPPVPERQQSQSHSRSRTSSSTVLPPQGSFAGQPSPPITGNFGGRASNATSSTSNSGTYYQHINDDLDIPDLGDWQWEADDPESRMSEEPSNNIGESEFPDGARAHYHPPNRLEAAIKSARTKRKLELASFFTNRTKRMLEPVSFFTNLSAHFSSSTYNTPESAPEHDGGLFTYPLPVILVCRPTRGARKFNRLFTFPRDLGFKILNITMYFNDIEYKWDILPGRYIQARNWRSAFFALLRGLGLIVLCLSLIALFLGFVFLVVILGVPFYVAAIFSIGLTTILNFRLFRVVRRLMTMGMSDKIYPVVMGQLNSVEMESPLIRATLASWMHWKVLVSFDPCLETMYSQTTFQGWAMAIRAQIT